MRLIIFCVALYSDTNFSNVRQPMPVRWRWCAALRHPARRDLVLIHRFVVFNVLFLLAFFTLYSGG